MPCNVKKNSNWNFIIIYYKSNSETISNVRIIIPKMYIKINFSSKIYISLIKLIKLASLKLIFDLERKIVYF